MIAEQDRETAVLVTAAERGAGGRIRVLAPSVGWWSDHPPSGAVLNAGSRIGKLESLNHKYSLVLPEGASGKLSSGLPLDRRVAVEYGQVLFELTPIRTAEPGDAPTGHRAARHSGSAALGERTWAVVSPIDGVFYRRPSSDTAPFVETGSRVRTGQSVGLVEAMKTFNQVLYGGPGFPEEGEIVEIRCEDVEEVRAGQVLMVVR